MDARIQALVQAWALIGGSTADIPTGPVGPADVAIQPRSYTFNFPARLVEYTEEHEDLVLGTITVDSAGATRWENDWTVGGSDLDISLFIRLRDDGGIWMSFVDGTSVRRLKENILSALTVTVTQGSNSVSFLVPGDHSSSTDSYNGYGLVTQSNAIARFLEDHAQNNVPVTVTLDLD